MSIVHVAIFFFFFLNEPPPPAIYTLSLHDALPIFAGEAERRLVAGLEQLPRMQREVFLLRAQQGFEYEEIAAAGTRSEEHTSELQSRLHLVCRLLLEKKKKKQNNKKKKNKNNVIRI